jgi:hypothetical protein
MVLFPQLEASPSQWIDCSRVRMEGTHLIENLVYLPCLRRILSLPTSSLLLLLPSIISYSPSSSVDTSLLGSILTSILPFRQSFLSVFIFFKGFSILNVQQYRSIPTIHQGHDRRISIAKRTMHRQNSKLQTTTLPTGVTPRPPFPRIQKPETIRQLESSRW